ncbi:uncharacterized protein MYCGRDRAFT_94793 [Zymoseptoria tritici IPO323]|uniref:Uncharacterized protein n=1 Tax=Zymoseptoria tritici (strain CBS 115943 / IPO323) TaxID=336722 RepID=F9XF66_ZYMTI|nr:uncharacterized protein MYCGRDRAFT_94793 [Zymoseptoria tritici IPO323]EGP85872.1 hypothetical protein MYCGRDRAFT_94793 [Zymoseptoria tritici IPO323]
MDEQTFRLMATRLPLELVYKIYGGLTLPKTLDLVVSNSIPSSEQDRIQCTNAEAWQGPISMLTTFPGLVPMVRADISTDIQAPHRDDAHSLNLRIEQIVPTRGWCMIKHSSRTTVPHDLLDLILSRFSRIKVHLLYSTDPERYSRGRLGGTLTFTYQRSSSDVWYFPDISQQGHSYYNNNFILPFRSSKIEKRVARAVEKSGKHAKRDSMGFLPAGSAFHQLERAVGHVEEWEEDQRRAELAWQKMCKVLFEVALLGLFVMVVSGISMAVAESEHAGIRGRR